MFGRVRAASSPLDDLELERPPSKLFKNDALSIYEATLMKLKLGAQRDVPPAFDVAMETQTDSPSSCVLKCCSDASSCSHSADDADCNSHTVLKSSQFEDMMMTDAVCSSENISPSSSDCQSSGSLKQQRRKTASVLYLFAKYRSAEKVKRSSLSQEVVSSSSSSQEEEVMTQNGGSSVRIFTKF